MYSVFAGVDALHHTQQLFSHVRMFSWVELEPSSEDKYLALGHNTVPPLKLKPVTSKSQDN